MRDEIAMKKNFTLAAWLSFSVILFPVNASLADQASLWKNVGGWEIRVDNTLGYGCFALAIYDGGTALRIGIDPSSDYNGYILLGNPKWKSLEPGKDYDLKIQFDKETPWTAVAKAVQFDDGGLVMLHASFDKGAVLKEFSKKHQVAFYYNDSLIDRLRLKGSALATRELIRCQMSMKETGVSKQKPDPFKNSSRNSDPFAN